MDQREIEAFREQVKLLTESLQPLSEGLRELNGATDKTSKNLADVLDKKFPNAAKPAMEGITGLGNAATDAAAAIYKGQRGMTVMANGLNTLADALQGAVAVATFFTPWGRALKLSQQVMLNGSAALAKGLASSAKITAEQSDKLFKTYQDLSKFGAAGANGLEGLFDTLQRAGFTGAELDQFTASIKKNAANLTYFGATAGDGARNLAAISGAIVKSDLGRGLEMMGYTAADIADSTATYLVLQQRLGRVQTKTASELAIDGAKFALEMDKMARLTGISREEQEKQRQSLINDERYAGFMATEAKQQGLNTTALESFITLFQDPETRRGIQHLVAGGGAITSPEAAKVQQTDPRAYELAMAVAQNRMSAVSAGQQFSASAGRYAATYGGQLARFGAQGPGINIGGEFGALGQSSRMEALTQAAANAGKSLDKFVNDEQEMAKFNKGELERQVDTRRSQMNLAQSLDAAVNSLHGLNSASSTLTRQFEKLSRTLPGAAGGAATTGGSAGTSNTMGGGGGISVSPPGGTLGAADYSGLKIKSAESTAGGASHPSLVSLARRIQDQLGGNLKYFSAFNDSFHQGTDSAHAGGRALDFVLNDPATAPSVAAFVRNMAGVKSVRDEYNNPSSRATAPHIHAEISALNGFNGIISGPASGYRPNLEMHKTEQIKISPISQSSDLAAATEGSMSALLEEMKELVSVSKNQLSVNEKMLRYQA